MALPRSHLHTIIDLDENLELLWVESNISASPFASLIIDAADEVVFLIEENIWQGEVLRARDAKKGGLFYGSKLVHLEDYMQHHRHCMSALLVQLISLPMIYIPVGNSGLHAFAQLAVVLIVLR